MATPRALDRTRNHDLLSLYLHHAGRSSIPADYHLWTCYSLVAACLGNRVCFERFRDQPLYPNLYVFLIGPSGVGKSAAIGTGRKFVEDPQVSRAVGPLSGLKVTAEYLIDAMARRTKTGEPAVVYLLTSEASATIGRGDRADMFIRTVTELFTGREQMLIEGTVGRGTRVLKNYCLNWLAGTTVEWLNDSVRRQDIAGGFFARVIPVVASVGPPTTAVEYPDDYDEVVERLHERFQQLTTLNGCFQFSEAADAAFAAWNEGRPRPRDELLAPSYERRPELVLKVAMCRAVMDDPLNLSIRRHHVADAIKHVDRALRSLPMLIDRAAESPETEGLLWVSTTIRSFGRIQHQRLLSWALRRGMSPKHLDGLISALIQARKVERVPTLMGVYYIWVDRRYSVDDLLLEGH